MRSLNLSSVYFKNCTICQCLSQLIKDYFIISSEYYLVMHLDHLLKEKEKLKAGEMLVNLQEMSFQERDHYLIDQLKYQLIDALVHLNAQSFKSSILRSVANNHHQLLTSILTFCREIQQVIYESRHFLFKHNHHTSQSLLLALILSKMGKKVVVVVDEHKMNRKCEVFVTEGEVDTVFYVKNCLEKENVHLLHFTHHELQDFKIGKEHIVIVDLFDSLPTEYYLFVDRHIHKLIQSNRLFLYHSTHQEPEVKHLLRLIEQRGEHNLQFVEIQLSPPHPIQNKGYGQRQELMVKLIELIQSTMTYAQKQNVIIFYPLDQPLHKYFRKLKETMVKSNLKDCINIITDKQQSLSKDRANIFLVCNNAQLLSWEYSYSKVFMIIDYGYMQSYNYDYELDCYVQVISTQSHLEKSKRMAWISADRPGSYQYLQKPLRTNFNHFLNYTQDISSFLLQAIHYHQLHLVDLKHQRVNKCLYYLQQAGIIKVSTKHKYQISDQRYVQYGQQGLSPMEIKLMLNVLDDPKLVDKNKQKYLNLMAMALSILRHCGSLRKVKQQFEGTHVKPYAVWRKTGYLQSCLQILTKCQLIEQRKQPHNSKSQEFRRKTSRVIEGMDLHCKFAKKKKNFQEMEIADLISEYSVNQQLFYQIRDWVDELRNIFEFEMIPILIDKEAVSRIMLYLTKSGPKTGAAYYTGSKSTEYANTKDHFPLSEVCLFSILNQRPEFLKLVRIRQDDEGKKITMANSISKESYVEVFGQAPKIKRVAVQKVQTEQKEAQEVVLEVAKQFCFQNIPSVVFEQLLKDRGQAIQQFQNQNNCQLYLLGELGKIQIKCFKDHNENKQFVWENLNTVIKKINDHCHYYSKKLHYMGMVNFILKEGADILEIVEGDQISRIIVKKLPPEIAKEYVEVVLEGFPFKSIEVLEPDQYSALPSAVVEFYSKRSFEEFQNFYHHNMLKQNYFEMEPLKDSEYNKISSRRDDVLKYGNIDSTLLFRWYTWKSLGKAQVKFSHPKEALKAIEAFSANPLLDAATVKVEGDPSNPCLVNISNLTPYTDEIYIGEAFKDFGVIESVEILKVPQKERLGDEQHIGHLLKTGYGINDDRVIKYRVISIEKKEYGLRIAKVALEEKRRLQMICERLNKCTGLMGEGRLYVEPIFQREILIPEGCLQIYIDLFQQLMESIKDQKPIIRTQIREDEQNERLYLVLLSSIEATLMFVLARFKQKLNGSKIDFPHEARHVIMNQIGIANFLDMEEKYDCKFVVSVYSSKIKVLAKKENIQAIAKDVENRLSNHFFYKITFTSKVYKYYQEHPELLVELQKEFELNLAQLQEDNWALLLEGSAINIQKAINWMNEKGKASILQAATELNTNTCGICRQQFEDSYRLFCEHRFCKECLLDYLRYSLSDMSLFPLKCPDYTCKKPINCMDLEYLLEYEDWSKIRTLTANEFLKKNDKYSYCHSPGCEQINRIQQSNIGNVKAQFMRCDVCKNSYCLDCMGAYHPARTCSEAKMSEDQLLKTYIEENGVRKCMGKRCRALCVRYTGCFKVQCTRCGVCMCFKCPADNMAYFDTPQECYDHLNNEHGGYF